MTSLPSLMLRCKAIVALVFNRRAWAENCFDQMLAHDPDNVHALTSRAHLRAQRGAAQAAIDDYTTLVTRWPERSAADWFNLGFLLDDQGRLDEAEAAFRRAVALDGKLDRAWYGLGMVLIRQQRFDEAIEALKRNTELQPMSPYGWYQLARVHMDMARPDEAKQIIRRLKGFEPKVAAQLERETGLVVSS